MIKKKKKTILSESEFTRLYTLLTDKRTKKAKQKQQTDPKAMGLRQKNSPTTHNLSIIKNV